MTLYSRANCHLCEEMMAGLQSLQPRYTFTVAVVDIDGDSTLAVRFGEHVPVLFHGERELCRHRIDPSGVGAYLSGFQSDR